MVMMSYICSSFYSWKSRSVYIILENTMIDCLGNEVPRFEVF